MKEEKENKDKRERIRKTAWEEGSVGEMCFVQVRNMTNQSKQLGNGSEPL